MEYPNLSDIFLVKTGALDFSGWMCEASSSTTLSNQAAQAVFSP